MILSPAVGWGGVYGSLFPEIPESIYRVIPESSPDGLWAMPYRSFESLGAKERYVTAESSYNSLPFLLDVL